MQENFPACNLLISHETDKFSVRPFLERLGLPPVGGSPAPIPLTADPR